ncbi:hypothetical protein KBD59_04910 [Candidatus Gracilibacteria bacterium]|nr:hypothetical protein [Candidatus Gracilibacteria bacterium]
MNFTVVTNSDRQSFMHMSVLSTEKSFLPILHAKTQIKAAFDKDIGQETNIIINNFQEVTKESFDEFHKDAIPDFAEL